MPPSKTRKNKKDRKAPQVSATEHPEGTIEIGNDKQRWVIKKTAAGTQRWVPFHSTSLFGYTPLTAQFLSTHIGKPVTVYERESSYTWPKNTKDFDVQYSFTGSGDAELHGKYIEGWLKHRTPPVKKNTLCILKGAMKSKQLDSTLQVSPLPAELVSTNLMNTDAFIKAKA